MKTKRILTVVGVVTGVCLLAAILFISASRAATAVQDGCFPVHKVQADETAQTIAQIYGIRVEDLLMANELASAEDIYVGQELCIPTGEPETSVVTQTLTIEATPATTETLGVEAAPTTTETLTIEATPATTETLGIQATPVTTETVVIQAGPVTTETLGIEATPATTETLVIQATPVTTETLGVEAAPVTTEGLVVKPPEGIPTRFCLRGQVIDEDDHGIAGVTVTAELGLSPGKSAKTNEYGYFKFTDLQPGSWIFRVALPDSRVDKDQVDKAQVDKDKADKDKADKDEDKADKDEDKVDKAKADKVDKSKDQVDKAQVDKDKADKVDKNKDKADKNKDKADKDKDDKDKDDKDKDDKDKDDQCRAYHTVRRGDHLSRIADQHDTSIRAIARANGIRDADVIYAGQKLCIP